MSASFPDFVSISNVDPAALGALQALCKGDEQALMQVSDDIWNKLWPSLNTTDKSVLAVAIAITDNPQVLAVALRYAPARWTSVIFTAAAQEGAVKQLCYLLNNDDVTADLDRALRAAASRQQDQAVDVLLPHAIKQGLLIEPSLMEAFKGKTLKQSSSWSTVNKFVQHCNWHQLLHQWRDQSLNTHANMLPLWKELDEFLRAHLQNPHLRQAVKCRRRQTRRPLALPDDHPCAPFLTRCVEWLDAIELQAKTPQSGKSAQPRKM